MTNSQNNEEILLAAIRSRELAQVKHAVETLNCRPGGSDPWRQLPLNTAAGTGNVAIFTYLIDKGARPETFTLVNAIGSGNLNMVRYLVEEYEDYEVTLKDYQAAFKAGTREEIIRYFFRKALDDGWFHTDGMQTDVRSMAWQICEAVRDMLVDRAGGIQDLISMLQEEPGSNLLHGYPDDETPLRLLYRLAGNDCVENFKAVWPLVYAAVFDSADHERMEIYGRKQDLNDLMEMLAVSSDRNKIFYFLLGYALPNLPRCLEVARKNHNDSMVAYLEQCLGLASN